MTGTDGTAPGPGTEEEMPRALPSIPVGSPGDRLLRESLTILRDRAEDRETREQLTEIIEGRRPALDLLEMPGFQEIANRGVAEFDRTWSAMSDDEKAAATAAGGPLLDEEPPPPVQPYA